MIFLPLAAVYAVHPEGHDSRSKAITAPVGLPPSSVIVLQFAPLSSQYCVAPTAPLIPRVRFAGGHGAARVVVENQPVPSE